MLPMYLPGKTLCFKPMTMILIQHETLRITYTKDEAVVNDPQVT